MTRLYEAPAYAPENGAWWTDTRPPQRWPTLDTDIRCEVAIIGGGFTGLNTALALAEAGVDVALFEAEHPGWGASGRNGGFCCLGGALLDEKALTRRYGASEADAWHATQRAAVSHVEDVLARHGIDAERHSDGETVLAHTARAWHRLRSEARAVADNHMVDAELIPKADLPQHGLAGPWHGALRVPVGFALNPVAYHTGLAQAAQLAGARLFAHSRVTDLRSEGGWALRVNGQSVKAGRVVLATNGYSSEDLPTWMRARTLPVQSSVIVTRPLSRDEQKAAGWWSGQMAYDTRRLLHYFRLMPDRRFLFGMRGGLSARASEQARVMLRIRHDFHRLFPAWKEVEITHHWSGLACLMASGTPFIGAVPQTNGLFAALGYHGNGVAMGSYAGWLVAQHLMQKPNPAPAFLARPPGRFPLGLYRRVLLRPAYLLAETFDL